MAPNLGLSVTYVGPPGSLLPLIAGRPKGFHLTGGGHPFRHINFFEATWECFQQGVITKMVFCFLCGQLDPPYKATQQHDKCII